MNERDNHPSLKAYLVYTLAAAFLFYEMALQASPSIMTHALMQDLHLDAAGLGIMASFYFFSYTLMQIPSGLLFDRYDARLLITIAVFICALGAFFFGTTTTASFAASGRFLMGIGSSFAFISVLVMAARWFPANYFALLVGVAQLLAAIGAMGGEVPLAALVSTFGWRETIISLSVIGFILTILVWLVIRNQPDQQLTNIPTSTNESIAKSLQKVLGNPQTWWVALYAFCSWAPITAFAELWGVPYLMTVYGINNTLAASAIAMTWIGLGVASPLLGWSSDRLGRRCVLLSSCAVIGLVTTSLILYVPRLPFSLMFLLLFGFGIATAGQILTFAIVKDNNRVEVTAAAMGFNNMAVVAGGALFQPLVGMLLRYFWEGSLKNNMQVYSIYSYKMALSVVPICFLIAWMVNIFFIKETYCKPKFPD